MVGAPRPSVEVLNLIENDQHIDLRKKQEITISLNGDHILYRGSVRFDENSFDSEKISRHKLNQVRSQSVVEVSGQKRDLVTDSLVDKIIDFGDKAYLRTQKLSI